MLLFMLFYIVVVLCWFFLLSCFIISLTIIIKKLYFYFMYYFSLFHISHLMQCLFLLHSQQKHTRNCRNIKFKIVYINIFRLHLLATLPKIISQIVTVKIYSPPLFHRICFAINLLIQTGE